MQEEDKNKMSKVTSMTPGGAIDLDARDPNNLNEHLQVIFCKHWCIWLINYLCSSLNMLLLLG